MPAGQLVLHAQLRHGHSSLGRAVGRRYAGGQDGSSVMRSTPFMPEQGPAERPGRDAATARVLESALAQLHHARDLHDGTAAFLALVVLRHIGVMASDHALFRLCSEARACLRSSTLPHSAEPLLEHIEHEAGELLGRIAATSP